MKSKKEIKRVRRKFKTVAHLQCMMFEKRIARSGPSIIKSNEVVTMEELRHLWGLKYEAILDLIVSGDLKAEKKYGVWRISVSSLNGFLSQLESEFPW